MKTLISLILLTFAAHPLPRAQQTVTPLTPGFSVEELPLQLSNINNIRFRPDGKLTALGYDGRIHTLHDTDGDGIEDQARPFWDKQTLSVPVGMAWTDEGLYVASNGKISFFPDRNRDHQADEEIVVVSNWAKIGIHSGGVDAAALTLDREGNLYFGLLTENYANPYLVKDGVARYSLANQRGTVQKFNLQTQQLETVATGIRVPYTLAFNKAGDLFLTDQEGETWVPNGNPLDELNHIIPGKNYGFPPRHDKYLPDLISEPPVVGFGPQHQSTCGFTFNEPHQFQKLFGPPFWEDDAIVTGQSRGKLWRVPLVKTPAGYLGKEILFARLRMLTTDVAISPQGALYVSCHSGQPDWGTGPKGQGKLFRITYTDPTAPQPVAIWPENQFELRVAFDKPIHPAITNKLQDMLIEFGHFVRPADRLENLKPPYKVVAEQNATPRGKLNIIAANLLPDGRTLSLLTDPHPLAVAYALTLPSVAAAKQTKSFSVDLGYTLEGVQAHWFSKGDSSFPFWSGWLPHLEHAANRMFTVHSAEHEKLFSLLTQPGLLKLTGQFHLPAAISYKLKIVSSTPVSFNLQNNPSLQAQKRGPSFLIEQEFFSPGTPLLFEIALETGSGNVDLHLAYSSSEDPTPRPIPFSALLLPWAPAPPATPSSPTQPPATEGGDFERGRALFFGQALQCATCHRIRGEGSTLGPDLTNLPHRDAASVLRDLREPDALINPDYVAYNLTLKNGDAATGLLRSQTPETLRLLDPSGREQVFQRSEIESLRVSNVSLMPKGLIDNLKESQLRDLMVFLLHEPPRRTTAELDTLLGKPSSTPPSQSAIHLVLVANKQDHGPGQHDYPAWQKTWQQLLAKGENVTVSTAWDWPSDEQLQKADALIFYYWNRGWSEKRYADLDHFLARGAGLVLFHSATIEDKEPLKLAQRIGLAAHPKQTKYLHTPLELRFVATNDLTRGFQKLKLLDEPYWPMLGDTNKINLLATTKAEGKEWPMIWTYTPGQGRVWASIAGHYSWTFDDPLFQVLALRGIAWAAGQPADRLQQLAREQITIQSDTR